MPTITKGQRTNTHRTPSRDAAMEIAQSKGDAPSPRSVPRSGGGQGGRFFPPPATKKSSSSSSPSDDLLAEDDVLENNRNTKENKRHSNDDNQSSSSGIKKKQRLSTGKGDSGDELSTASLSPKQTFADVPDKTSAIVLASSTSYCSSNASLSSSSSSSLPPSLLSASTAEQELIQSRQQLLLDIANYRALVGTNNNNVHLSSRLSSAVHNLAYPPPPSSSSSSLSSSPSSSSSSPLSSHGASSKHTSDLAAQERARQHSASHKKPPPPPVKRNTGQWTAGEHALCLQGYEQHGKDWKKIASLVKSRTPTQVKTHANSYLLSDGTMRNIEREKEEKRLKKEAAVEAARKKFEQEKAEQKAADEAAGEAARKKWEQEKAEQKAADEAAGEAARKKWEQEKAEQKAAKEAARKEREEEAARKEVERALAKLLSDVEASEEERQKKKSALAVARLINPEALKATAQMIEERVLEKESGESVTPLLGDSVIIGRGTTTFPPTSWSGITLPTGRPPVVRPPVMPATHHDSPVNSTEEEPTTSFLQSMQENLFEWKKIAVTTQVAHEQCGPHCGLTGDVMASDTLTSNRMLVVGALIHSYPVPGSTRMLEQVDKYTLRQTSLNQTYQMLITDLRNNHDLSTEDAVQLVNDGTVWIDPINAVGVHDLRSDPDYKKTFDYLANNLDLRYTSLIMLKTLLEQFPNLKAIYAVGAEGFKMLELLREFFREQITQYESVYHPSQLHLGFANEGEVSKFLKQVILPCCDILSGKEPTPTDEIPLENINLLSYVRKIAKDKSSNK